MTKQTFTLCLIATVTLLGGLRCQPLHAQSQARTYRPGELVATGGGISAKILQCRGTGENEECEVQYYRGEALESTPRWENTLFLRNAEERIRNEKRQQAGEQPVAEPGKPEPAAPPPAKTLAVEGEPNLNCALVAPVGDTAKTAKPSAQLFKRKIYDNYHVIVNGTNSAPLNLGVTFLSFQVGQSFTNVVRVDPATGAHRLNDAAPVNATIFPIRSEHIVCEQYRDRTLRRRVANKYACFKNRDGEWMCGADGIPRITELD